MNFRVAMRQDVKGIDENVSFLEIDGRAIHDARRSKQ